MNAESSANHGNRAGFNDGHSPHLSRTFSAAVPIFYQGMSTAVISSITRAVEYCMSFVASANHDSLPNTERKTEKEDSSQELPPCLVEPLLEVQFVEEHS